MTNRRPLSDSLATDLYELTMVQSYIARGMTGEAVFDLVIRALPEAWGYLIACGLGDALTHLEALRFTPGDLAALADLHVFTPAFLDVLRDWRFSGDVFAVPEGTLIFAGEPVLEVVAPLPEAQLVETFLLASLPFQMAVAAETSRLVRAAAGRPVIDFGLRRAPGVAAGLQASRAFYLAGGTATSNVSASLIYGIPLAGTMAHSFIQAHDREIDAFRHFARSHPTGTLLVDTYDALGGIANVIKLAHELGPAFRIAAVRLDSGPLAELAVAARRALDAAGLAPVRIFASGGLDERRIARLVRSGAPIDGFGVGAAVSWPAAHGLDAAYKLVAYQGRGRMKLSPGKASLPGRKQIFRRYAEGSLAADTLGACGEGLAGEPLLQPVMAGGRRLPAGSVALTQSRATAARELAALPPRLAEPAAASVPFLPRLSPRLEGARAALAARLSSPDQG